MAKAPKIVISHRLHEDGMKVLEDAGAEVVIVGSGEPADMLPYLKDADGVITVSYTHLTLPTICSV